MLHKGFIYDCDLVKNETGELRTKICKIVGDKVSLAARFDNSGAKNGLYGIELKNLILAKIEILKRPQKARTVKALVIPQDKPFKRRGGKR